MYSNDELSATLTKLAGIDPNLTIEQQLRERESIVLHAVDILAMGHLRAHQDAARIAPVIRPAPVPVVPEYQQYRQWIVHSHDEKRVLNADSLSNGVGFIP